MADQQRIAEIESLQADAASYQQVKKRLHAEGFEDLDSMIAEYKQVLIEANEHAIEADDERENLEAQLAASQRRERAMIYGWQKCLDRLCYTCYSGNHSAQARHAVSCDVCPYRRGPQETEKGEAE